MEAADAGRVRRARTAELTDAELAAVRALIDAAFGDEPENSFTEDDWQHTLGGVHFLVEHEGEVISHAAVVERELHIAGSPLLTGYVEAVATAPERQGQGFGTSVMSEVADYIGAHFELGALGTGSQRFYGRLGWEVWRGPTYVRTPDGDRRTPDEDGGILILRTGSTPPLDLRAPISCEWRPGDVW